MHDPFNSVTVMRAAYQLFEAAGALGLAHNAAKQAGAASEFGVVASASILMKHDTRC